MLRRILPAGIGVVLLAAACGREPIIVRSSEPEEPAFFSQVVDFDQDVGAGLSMATDADGNPHLAYLALPEETEGETAAPPAAGAPVFPAVKHAHLVDNVWTRTSVAEDLKGLTADDETAIWVDQEGTHHIAWTQGGDLYYTDNPEGGADAKPQLVTKGPVEGISIAAGDDGTPWISFYQGGQVSVGTLSGKKWSTEMVAAADPGTPARTAIRVAGKDPIVAFGDKNAAVVATTSGDKWSTETADEDGGLGVAMVLDADGDPNLASYDHAGTVKHAEESGGGWKATQVGDAGGVPDSGAAAVVVDSQGVHHVAWQNADGTISYANDEQGDFGQAEDVPRSEGGALPVLAVNGEDEAWLGWFDTQDTEVQLALRSEEAPLLALPSPTAAAPTGGTTGGAAACQPDGTDLQISAPPGAASDGFDTDCLAAPAGEAVTVDFTNDDNTVHNWALFTDSSATEQIAGGTTTEPIAAGDSTTYDVGAIKEPGNYFFRCDFHPDFMTGTFVVAKGK